VVPAGFGVHHHLLQFAVGILQNVLIHHLNSRPAEPANKWQSHTTRDSVRRGKEKARGRTTAPGNVSVSFACQDEDEVTYFVLELERETRTRLRIMEGRRDVDLELRDASQDVDRVSADPCFVPEDVVLSGCFAASCATVLECGLRHAGPFTFDSAAGPDRDSPCFPAAVTGSMGLAA